MKSVAWGSGLVALWLLGASCGTSGPDSSSSGMPKTCEPSAAAQEGGVGLTCAARNSGAAGGSQQCINHGAKQVCTSPTNCCKAGPPGGCGDDAVKKCVCDIDPVCCSIAWANECILQATGSCGAICP